MPAARRARPKRQPPKAARPHGRATAGRILDGLAQAHPDADCALHRESPFQLLVATILSAQCTDARVNAVTPELFRRFPDAAALAGAEQAQVEELIRSTGFFRAKATNLIGCAKALVETHGGGVPRSLEALVKLPGIGRKTASVVLGHAYGLAEGIAVDTHVQRLANRLGLVASDDPGKIEERLMEVIPRERWIQTTDLLIFHGRRVCDARRPRCGACIVFPLCRWEQRQAWATAGDRPRSAGKGRR